MQVFRQAFVFTGVMAAASVAWVPAAAQLPAAPLYPPSPPAAPSYIPAPRYPTDSRNLTLDNRAPTLWPAGPELRDATPRLGSRPDYGAFGTDVRRIDGLRAPSMAEPGQRSWR
jgi:hypothetical protein